MGTAKLSALGIEQAPSWFLSRSQCARVWMTAAILIYKRFGTKSLYVLSELGVEWLSSAVPHHDRLTVKSAVRDLEVVASDPASLSLVVLTVWLRWSTAPGSPWRDAELPPWYVAPLCGECEAKPHCPDKPAECTASAAGTNSNMIRRDMNPRSNTTQFWHPCRNYGMTMMMMITEIIQSHNNTSAKVVEIY